MKKDKEIKTVPRITKVHAKDIMSKGLFYYIDEIDDENTIYALVDNRKGKNKIIEVNTLDKLEKKIKDLLK